MPESKRFHIGDVLSVVSGRILSLNSLNGVQQLLEFMNQGPVSQINMPAAVEAFREPLLQQHPELRIFKPSDADGVIYELREKWLAAQAQRFNAEYMAVIPLQTANHLQLR